MSEDRPHHPDLPDGALAGPSSPSRALPPQGAAAERLEGQLGPDEISEPDEVIKNNEANLHADGVP